MRVAVYNMQGGGSWHNVRLLFDNYAVDIALLQECGKPPLVNLIQDHGDVKIYEWDGRYMYHLEYGSGNSRCSTAVVLNKGITAETWKHFDPDQQHSDRRRVLCVKVADTWYCTLHAPGFGGTGALEYADYMLKKCNTDFAKFVCGGDYNNEAQYLYHISSKVQPSPPSKKTHASGKIDYVVTKGVVYQCADVGNIGQSDHAWAIFES
jgi:hypothetical protein